MEANRFEFEFSRFGDRDILDIGQASIIAGLVEIDLHRRDFEVGKAEPDLPALFKDFSPQGHRRSKIRLIVRS